MSEHTISRDLFRALIAGAVAATPEITCDQRRALRYVADTATACRVGTYGALNGPASNQCPVTQAGLFDGSADFPYRATFASIFDRTAQEAVGDHATVLRIQDRF